MNALRWARDITPKRSVEERETVGNTRGDVVDLDGAFAALLRLSERGDGPRRAVVAEATIRLDEAAATVRSVVAAAYTRCPADPEQAEALAKKNYRVLAKSWPKARRKILDGYACAVMERTRQTEDVIAETRSRAARARRLLDRLVAAAADSVSAAQAGQNDALAESLRRLLVLRDVACRLGVLLPETAKALTEAFAVDLATSQIQGEIRHLVAQNPLQGLAKALVFRPDLPPAHAASLQAVALDEAVRGLHETERVRLAAQGEAMLSCRASGYADLVAGLEAYVAGRPLSVETMRVR
ncbi:MAG: hypothetical protein JXQ84_04390, partial [Rhodospirillaceae bacterium]|nr:hypothetical protein [Rhodospirillaceae bacterium]